VYGAVLVYDVVPDEKEELSVTELLRVNPVRAETDDPALVIVTA
jgi:hypothetical protein